jgi:hypothetical protein
VPSLAVFAYGSLVHPDSAAVTLGRAVPPQQIVRLAGWTRRWSQARDNLASEKTFARADGSLPAFVLGLNVERLEESKAGANGALIEVSEAELERLDIREIRYDRVDVTADVDALPSGIDRVIAYVAKPERFAPEPPPGAVILSTYAGAVEAAFSALGSEQLALYRETTQPPPVEVIEGHLVRDEIPPGNPRAW